MKSRRFAQQPPVLDLAYFSQLYQKVSTQMNQLDQLHKQFKTNQQQKFAKTFMDVVEKMGNQLIMAKQAYRKVDVQARKDDFCVALATELSFFKQESLNLKEIGENNKRKLQESLADNMNLQAEIKQLKIAQERKTKECLKLRDIIRQLKKQINYLSNPQKNDIFKFTSADKDSLPISKRITPRPRLQAYSTIIRSAAQKKRRDMSPSLQIRNDSVELKTLQGTAVSTNRDRAPFRSRITAKAKQITVNFSQKSARRRILPQFYDPQKQ